MHQDQAQILGAQKPAGVVKIISNHYSDLRINGRLKTMKKNNPDG